MRNNIGSETAPYTYQSWGGGKSRGSPATEWRGNSAIRKSKNFHPYTCWRKHKLLAGGKVQWNLFVENLVVVTTYTSASVSIRGNFHWDRVLFNRRTLVSHF